MSMAQFIVIVLLASNLYTNWRHDGDPRTDKYSFITAAITTFLWIILLAAGGFWK